MADALSGSFWEDNPHAAQESQWTSDPFIAATIYSRISNGESEGHWIGWLFEKFRSERSFGRMLSIGCGVGDHEVAMGRLNPEATVEAFDFSAASVEIASQKARDEGLSNVRFFQGDFNVIELEPDAFDLVLCSGSLHHVRELEHLLGQVRRALTPGGMFIVNEYVGDCYNIYGDEQVALLTSILGGLPPSLRHAASYPIPTIEQVFDRDPTEGVRAKLIPDFLRIYFENVDERRLGGAVLHPIFPFINVDAFRAQPDFHRAYMNLLIELDGHLIADGKSDFSFFICR